MVWRCILSNCKKDEESDADDNNNNGGTTGTLDPNTLTDVLEVAGSVLKSGNMPAPTGSSTSPTMIMVDTTVSYSSGSQVRLPIDYIDNSGSGIAGIRFQVNGANRYFEIASFAAKSTTMLLPIGVPSSVSAGLFCISITVYDADGNVSNTFETCVTVTNTMGCDVERVSGGEGITSTLHNMGSNPGVVKIEYETYVVPDRIDVFYNGIWVAGTGSNPGALGIIPPLANCSSPTDGYIGDNGTFCFMYDPDYFSQKVAKIYDHPEYADIPVFKGTNLEHFVEVVVSGCVRGGTLWKYEISCADPDDDCYLGQEGSPRFNLQFDGDVDFDLHVIDPSGEEIYYANSASASGGALDVDCICCDHGNENIYWISGTAPTGQYEYWVYFYGDCSDADSDFTITVTSNGNIVDVHTGNLSSVGTDSQHWFLNQ